MNTNPILVGYDGSLGAGAALNWALAEADRRSAPLRLVYVHEWATTVVPVPAGHGWPDPQVRREAVAVIDEAVTRARTAQPAVPTTGTVIDGPVTATLRKLSEQAGLLVLGNRGLGGFTGLLIGSVAVQVAAHGAAPVLIVRGEEGSQGPVVVGVDGSLQSNRALGFAMEEAALRGAELVAVHAWRYPVSTGPGDMLPLVYDRQEQAAEESLLLAEAVAGWSERYPDVPVRRRVVRDWPAPALVAESRAAQLLVVGARGRGGFTGLLLGSVSQAVLHHSSCPVAVVRQDLPPPGAPA